MAATLKLLFLGVNFVWIAFAEMVTNVETCAETSYSVGSNANEFDCQGIPQKFTVDTSLPAAVLSATFEIHKFTFYLQPKLTLTAVGTCPEKVQSLSCGPVVVFFGTSATANDGSTIEIDGKGFSGLSLWPCTFPVADGTEGAAFYYFPITFSTDSAVSPSGELKDAVDTFKALRASGPYSPVGSQFKLAALHKFEAVDESTTAYYMKTGNNIFHKIFLSTATTITFTAGDYEEAFGNPSVITTGPTVAGVCENAVQINKKSSSSKISVASLLMLASFTLSLFERL